MPDPFLALRPLDTKLVTARSLFPNHLRSHHLPRFSPFDHNCKMADRKQQATLIQRFQSRVETFHSFTVRCGYDVRPRQGRRAGESRPPAAGPSAPTRADLVDCDGGADEAWRYPNRPNAASDTRKYPSEFWRRAEGHG